MDMSDEEWLLGEANASLRAENRELRAQLEAALAELERLKSSLAPKKRRK